jgi:hypothetical protein
MKVIQEVHAINVQNSKNSIPCSKWFATLSWSFSFFYWTSSDMIITILDANFLDMKEAQV